MKYFVHWSGKNFFRSIIAEIIFERATIIFPKDGITVFIFGSAFYVLSNAFFY